VAPAIRTGREAMSPDESCRLALAEPVRLVPYDSRWPACFDAERERVMGCIGSHLVHVCHFGSTAVPGMAAKPTIDIIAGLRDMAIVDQVLQRLCEHGYSHAPELDLGAPERRFLFRHADGHRTHHLHLVAFDASTWRERIRFRDLLRSDPRLRASYAALKRELAARHQGDRDAYTRGKAEFIRGALTSAGEVPGAVRSIPC